MSSPLHALGPAGTGDEHLPFTAKHHHILQSSKRHDLPFETYTSILELNEEVYATVPRTSLARWRGRSEKTLCLIMHIGVIGAVIGIAFLVLRCFRSLLSGRNASFAKRRLAGNGDNGDCGVSCVKAECGSRIRECWLSLFLHWKAKSFRQVGCLFFEVMLWRTAFYGKEIRCQAAFQQPRTIANTSPRFCFSLDAGKPESIEEGLYF